MLGCLGRDKVSRMPSVFDISSLLKKPYLVTEIINMPSETRKLIMFANCSNPSSPFVIIKVSMYTAINYNSYCRNMPSETRKLIMFANCSNPSSPFVIIKVSIPESFLVLYHQTAIMYSSRLLHNMVLTHLGWIVWEATYVIEFIACMLRTSKSCF